MALIGLLIIGGRGLLVLKYHFSHIFLPINAVPRRHKAAINVSKPGEGRIGLAVGVFCSGSMDINGVVTGVAVNIGEGAGEDSIPLVGSGDGGETVSVGTGGGTGVGETVMRGIIKVGTPPENLKPFGTTSIFLTL